MYMPDAVSLVHSSKVHQLLSKDKKRSYQMIVTVGTRKLLVSHYQCLLCISDTAFELYVIIGAGPHGGVLV